MKFKSVGKSIFYYTNEKNEHFLETHIINNLKILHEYEIIFNGNKTSLNDDSKAVITFKDDFDNFNEVILPINSNYKFQNRNILSTKLKFIISEDTIFSIYILEKPIVFREYEYENSTTIKNFIRNIDSEEINHRKLTPTFNINVACILDEFTYECFSHEVNLFQIKSPTWKEDILKCNPEFLLVESAWNGICNTWIGKIACENKIDKTLQDLINYCNESNIATVFFNKEGLVNLNYFGKNSSLFDYIFVTDENIIPIQKDLCNHNNIYPLSFAAQPKIHNSINKNKYKLGNIAFAGGWYGNRHLDRLNDFDYILKPALNYNLHIYDRNYHQRSMLEFIDMYWPEIYIPSILGKLEYKYMVHAHKNYSLFLNVNSVQNSTYMMSRRVYEILCCKTMVLSSYSKGIYDNFKDYIFISKSENDTVSILENINKSPHICDKLGKKAQRYILENHTYKNRIINIFNKLNIKYNLKNKINVTILAFLDDINHMDNLHDILYNQQYEFSSIYLLSPHHIDFDKTCKLFKFNNIKHFKYTSLEDFKYILKQMENLDCYFAVINSHNYYGPNYIRDYVNILSFVDCDVLGKSLVFEYKNGYVNSINCCNKDSFVDYLYRDTIFFNDKYLHLLSKNPTLLKDNILYQNNHIFYSDDEFNFISNLGNSRDELSLNLNNFII